ncbi:MAG: CRISPR-associated helicase Cas3' [Myxococcales bacterium]|nr:CRISPR-associated helicase Cas3' [Polyangiaceae bacterium]MDW8250369.1 CRISPR-associated helicase Cas3' [Myxococcales bacterium]
MKRIPKDFWGKLQKEEGRILAWHPLLDHCADVAACGEALLQGSLLRQRLARLAGWNDLSPSHRARLGVLIALHDLGKFNLGFQNKALPSPPFTAGHVAELVSILGRESDAQQKLFEALKPDQFLSWVENDVALTGLLLASVAHHGRPIPLNGPDRHQPRFWEPDRGLDPFEGIHRLVEAAFSWFPEAREPSAPFPACTAFQHAFSGLVMLADWIGSSTEFFPYSEPGDGPRIDFARRSAKETLTRMGLHPQASRSALGTVPPGFDRISPHAPRALQEAILALPLPPEGGLTILEAQTGSGKTEAALARFLRLFHEGLVDGLYFALPTRTAATQIHERVCQAVARAFPEPSTRPPVVLAVPGYLRVDDATGIRLPGFEVLWNDDPEAQNRHRYWAAENSKRYLAGAIVVGTIDQVLLSTIQVAHAHLRSTALLRQLLVVDEVHASDAYMTVLLQAVLSNHLAAGGHALLMSATLGSEARSRFLGASAPPPLDQTLRLPYPALTDSPGGKASPPLPIPNTSPDRSVDIEIQPILDDAQAIARLALDAAVQGARVIVLRNTVRGCLEVQKAVECLAATREQSTLLFTCHGQMAPHHARFAREDRQALDRALEAVFSPPDYSRGCLVVATQTIQQSLDLDADLLLTDLCPMDVLLQRLGRLHRHRARDQHRPPVFVRARMLLLTPSRRDLGQMIQSRGEARGLHGLGTVYEDLRILEATWRLAERYSCFRIPTMCRELVERSTHPEALDALVKELGGLWEQHQRHLRGSLLADRRTAHLGLLDRKQPFGEAQFPDDPKEVARQITTRLGERDRLLTFDPPFPGPFGLPVRTLTLPAHLARGLSETDPPRPLPDRSGFSVGSRSFLYDRLGLRPLDDEPLPEALDA